MALAFRIALSSLLGFPILYILLRLACSRIEGGRLVRYRFMIVSIKVILSQLVGKQIPMLTRSSMTEEYTFVGIQMCHVTL